MQMVAPMPGLVPDSGTGSGTNSSETASKTDVAASKAKTRVALLAGLRNGNLEAAVAKMEDDVAAEESFAEAAPGPGPEAGPEALRSIRLTETGAQVLLDPRGRPGRA